MKALTQPDGEFTWPAPGKPTGYPRFLKGGCRVSWMCEEKEFKGPTNSQTESENFGACLGRRGDKWFSAMRPIYPWCQMISDMTTYTTIRTLKWLSP